MKKLITIILVLATSVAFGQTNYQLNYDSIRVGKTAGNGATSLYGKTYLKNATEGSPSDSVLTVRNGRVYKIAGSAISSVGFLTYVFSRNASDISGYEQMPALTSYTIGAADTATVSATTTPAIIQEFATNTGFPNTTLIPSGVFNVTYQTQKNSGSQSYYTYAVIYKRNLAGAETAIATTNNSSSVSANTVQSVSVSAVSPTDISVLTTDRIVVKVFAVMVSGTANISIYYDDATDSRLAFPSALVDATNFMPYNGAVKDLVSAFSITGDSIKRVGGTGAQFLMGNGTIQDTTQIQTVANFFPKGDTRYARLSGGSGYIQNQTASPQTASFNINGDGQLNNVGLSNTQPASNSVLKYVKNYTLDNLTPFYGLNTGVSFSKTGADFDKYVIGAVFHTSLHSTNTANFIGDGGVHNPFTSVWGQVDGDIGSTGRVSKATAFNAVADLYGGDWTFITGYNISNVNKSSPATIDTLVGYYANNVNSGAVNYSFWGKDALARFDKGLQIDGGLSRIKSGYSLRFNNADNTSSFGIFNSGATGENEAYIDAALIPDLNETRNIGSSSKYWNNIYSTSFIQSKSANGLILASKFRNISTDSNAYVQSSWGNNESENAFTIQTFGGNHSSLPNQTFIINQRNASLKLGGYGGIALELGASNSVNMPVLAGTGTRMVESSSTGELSATKIVTSGTYTPTLTNTSGIASSTAGTGSYQRIGNQVSGFVDFTATGTSEGVSGVFGVSLPIPSNFSSSTNVWGGYGVGRAGETIAPLEEVSADTTNDRFIVKATLTDLSVRTIRINFNYTIL